jgi:pimeloyl-ACP methyl ester carboxylesterase
MKNIQRFPRAVGAAILAAGLAAILGTSNSAAAQDVSDLQTPNGSLVLKAQGSFFMGGQSVNQTATQVGGFGFFPGGHITINQMYVQYMIPQGNPNKVPVVMIHGGTLSGKSWETTPDGRMGWDEYFVRNGHAVYKPDQVSRARSGFNQAVFNDARAGNVSAASQPLITRLSDEVNWTIFRFGPTNGVPFPDTQFPIDAVGKFSKQGIPDLIGGPNAALLADLANQLNGAVIMGHSESGLFPIQAVLANPAGIKGAIDIEPGSCNATGFTDQQVATLATVPILVVFGDHLGDIAPGQPVGITLASLSNCRAFAARVNAVPGGNATVLLLPDAGLKGNSHMMMLDKNNLQVADLLLKWIDDNVGKSKVANN